MAAPQKIPAVSRFYYKKQYCFIVSQQLILVKFPGVFYLEIIVELQLM